MRDAALPLLAAAFLMLAPAAARADEPPREAVRLSYDIGPGLKTCPPEQTLHDEVARRMGYDPFTPDALDRIVATLKRSPRGLTATVERFDSKDVPQWQPKTYDMKSDCALLVQQLAIYISFRFLPFAVPPQPAPPASSPSSLSPSLTKGAASVAQVKTGSVGFPQRFGGSLNLHVHFHTLGVDAVVEKDGDGGVRVHETPPPSQTAIGEVAQRVRDRALRFLRRRGYLEERPALERVKGGHPLYGAGDSADRDRARRVFARLDKPCNTATMLLSGSCHRFAKERVRPDRVPRRLYDDSASMFEDRAGLLEDRAGLLEDRAGLLEVVRHMLQSDLQSAGEITRNAKTYRKKVPVWWCRLRW